jgi:hypothetical protein
MGWKAEVEGTMTEATGGGGRAEVEGRLIQRSLAEEVFRQRLLDDPKAAVEQELGTRLPQGVQVRVVEESADTIYLVLPSISRLQLGFPVYSLECVEGLFSEICLQDRA